MPGSVLLVDDEEGIRKVVGITLRDLGYTVDTAENAEIGLGKFRQAGQDIVITDMRMPGMSGLELLSTIKSESPDTEVIIITGHGDMELAIEGLKRQAGDFIHKPLSEGALEIALTRAEEKIAIRAKMRQYTQNLEALVREQSAKLVEMERRSAACQAAEDMALAMRGLAGELDGAGSIFNAVPCYVSFLDRELKLVSANRAYRERFGERLGQPGFTAYEGVNAATCPAALTLASGEPYKGEHTLLYPDGGKALAEVRTAALRGAGGEIDLVMEIAADLGEARRLREELRAAQERFERLFNEAPCAIAVLEQDLRLCAANQAFESQFGREGGALSLRPPAQGGTLPEDSPLLKTLKDGQTHQLESLVQAKNGEPRNIYVTSAPLSGPDGRTSQVMELTTDITQLRRLQDHLASLGMLLASLSHGIKGILTALDGGVYQVDSGLAKSDPERVENGWLTVKQLIARIKGMILDILYYSRKRELNLAPIALAELAREVADVAEVKANAAGVELLLNLAPDLGQASLDAAVISAALVNILENAVEACALDSSKPEHTVLLGLRQADGFAVFEISDNGCGMDERTKSKVFSVFFSTKGSKGTGLGLFITKHAVEQHGGRIEVESAPGQGTTFRLWLPLGQPGPEPQPD